MSQKHFMAKMEERKKRAASQYAVGAAAIAAMRGGLDKKREGFSGSASCSSDDEDDDAMLRKAERANGNDIQTTAQTLSNFETKLEEVRRRGGGVVCE